MHILDLAVAVGVFAEHDRGDRGAVEQGRRDDIKVQAVLLDEFSSPGKVVSHGVVVNVIGPAGDVIDAVALDVLQVLGRHPPMLCADMHAHRILLGGFGIVGASCVAARQGGGARGGCAGGEEVSAFHNRMHRNRYEDVVSTPIRRRSGLSRPCRRFRSGSESVNGHLAGSQARRAVSEFLLLQGILNLRAMDKAFARWPRPDTPEPAIRP